jgi:hypothetical protein
MPLNGNLTLTSLKVRLGMFSLLPVYRLTSGLTVFAAFSSQSSFPQLVFWLKTCEFQTAPLPGFAITILPLLNRLRFEIHSGDAHMAKPAGKTKTNSAFMKPMQPSEQLAKIVGTEPLPRSEVTKKVWAHIKKHKLQNPQNKREIIADDKLQPIFGGKKLDMFQMTKAVNKHLK